MKDVLVIVNPASAGGRTARAWPAAAARLRSAGLDFDAALTEAQGQATELARQGVAGGRRIIAAAGGDGTINEVVNGFFVDGEPIAGASRLGVVPLGTGGDFRRTLDIPLDLEAAAGVLKRGSTRRLDAGRVTFSRPDGRHDVRFFINIAAAGIAGEVSHRVNTGFKLGPGEVTFAIASLVTLMAWRNKPMRAVVDGEVRDIVAQQIVVANCRYYGGGMMVAPRAQPDDGFFDVLVAGDLGLVDNLRGFAKIRAGRHLDQPSPKLSHQLARRIEISSPDAVRVDLDGEVPGILPAVFEIVPAAIEALVP